MDPTIAGALIGGGFAVIGFAASAWTNKAAIRESRRAARDQRLWEKRSALYEALLKPLTAVDLEKARAEDMAKVGDALREQNTDAYAYASDAVLTQCMAVISGLEAISQPTVVWRHPDPRVERLIGRIKDEAEREREAQTAAFYRVEDVRNEMVKLRTAIRCELQQVPWRRNRDMRYESRPWEIGAD